MQQLLSLYNVITHKNTIIKSVSPMLIPQSDQGMRVVRLQLEKT